MFQNFKTVIRFNLGKSVTVLLLNKYIFNDCIAVYTIDYSQPFSD